MSEDPGEEIVRLFKQWHTSLQASSTHLKAHLAAIELANAYANEIIRLLLKLGGIEIPSQLPPYTWLKKDEDKT